MGKAKLSSSSSGKAGLRDYLLAASSGALLALSFPKPGLSLLAWFSFVPLFLAMGKKNFGSAFKLGFTCGITAYAGILYWLNIVMITYGKLNWGVSVCLFLILAAYLALYIGLIAGFVNRGNAVGIPILISFPVLWVGLEYLRSFLLTGFPWASLGYSQYSILPLIQIADITGVYGLSFLIALSNALLYLMIRSIAGKGGSGKYPTAGVIVFVLLMALTLGYGFYRLNTPDEGRPLKVALIQGNISQDVKWDPAFQEATVATYERLCRRPEVKGSDLVVWPESAAPFFFQYDLKYTPRIKKLAAELKTPMVIGSPAVEKRDGEDRYLNSAYLIGADGEVLGRSDKIHLVPFGEYVPMARFLPFVNKLVAGVGDFSPGTGISVLNPGKGPIGILICFEGIFPEISRAYVRAGSRLLVNISNDAWYKRSSAPYQHLSMTVFRAVENRVPLVRATNTGISSIIDSKGHIRGTTPLFQEAVLAGEVRMGRGDTFYDRYGDAFAIICLALAGMISLTALVKKSKKW